MAKKSKKSGKAAAGEHPLASAVKASAQQIWLAGMGAFAKAHSEGSKVFDTLVQEGSQLQRKTQTAAVQRYSEAAELMSSLAGEVSTRAGASLNKLESLMETGTAKTMSRLGVPTAQAMQTLTQRVDALTAQIERLQKSGAVKKTAAKARKTAAKSPAAKSGRAASKRAGGS